MGDGSTPSKRKLTVTKCDFGRSGTTNGKDWTMYDVACRGEDGAPIDLKFNSFEPLPVGELLEYDVTYRDSDRFGRTYTLKRPGQGGSGGGGGLGKSVDDLRGRVERVEAQVESIISGAVPVGQQQATSRAPAAEGPPPAGPPPAAPASGNPDDDIPF